MNPSLADGFVVGSSLVARQGQGPSTSIAPLLPNGKIGGWVTLPGDPETVVQNAIVLPNAPSGRWGARRPG